MAIEIVDLPIKKWWFSIAMLVHQRVSVLRSLNRGHVTSPKINALPVNFSNLHQAVSKDAGHNLRLNVSEMKTVSSPCRLRNISIKVASSSSSSAAAAASSSSQIWSLKLDLDIIYILYYIYITSILNVDKQFILLFQKMFFSHSAASEQHPVADSRWIPCRPNVSPGCPTLANGQTQAFGGSSGCKIAKFPSDDVRIYI